MGKGLVKNNFLNKISMFKIFSAIIQKRLLLNVRIISKELQLARVYFTI